MSLLMLRSSEAYVQRLVCNFIHPVRTRYSGICFDENKLGGGEVLVREPCQWFVSGLATHMKQLNSAGAASG